MLGTIICAVALVLILVGILHEEKVIAFEDRVWEYIKDRVAYVVAKIYVKTKRLFVNSKIRLMEIAVKMLEVK